MKESAEQRLDRICKILEEAGVSMLAVTANELMYTRLLQPEDRIYFLGERQRFWDQLGDISRAAAPQTFRKETR